VPRASRLSQPTNDLVPFASHWSDPKHRRRRFSRFMTPFYLGFCLAFLVAPPLRAADEGTASSGNCELSAQQDVATPESQPKITSVKFISPPPTGDKTVSFTLAIDGENFGNNKSVTIVMFTTKDPAQTATATVASVTPTEIIVKGSAGPTTDITKITLTIGNLSVTSPECLTVSLKPNPPAPKTTSPATFTIKLDPETNKEFPNLHTLIATKETGDIGFGEDRDLIALELLPPGITALNIENITDDRLSLSYVAAADYVPKTLSVIVYTNSDLKTRKPSAIAKPAADKKEDANQPKITSVETVFLDRSQGNGRIRIYGQGFGDYDSEGLPFLADDYLRCDIARPRISFPPSQDPKRQGDPLASEQQLQYDKRWDDPYCQVYQSYKRRYLDWRAKIRTVVEPGIRSREDALDVERIEILYIDDKVVDLYFEFFRRRGFSEPFRLGSTTLSIHKKPVSTTQTVKGECVTGSVTGPVETDYVATQDIGPQPNTSLTYTYSVLDHDSAKVLFGAGVAHNFYVVKLSIVNTGKKKISVPLASIQAEAEWARGRWFDEKHNREIDYFEGPSTISPVPLAAVSAYFNSDYKVTGARAITLNVLDGIVTLGSAAVPFAGPSFKIGASVFTAGFVPGLRKYIGDLSDQQLQTLTGQSWQSSETVSANGGSIDKFVFIQRKGPSRDEPVDYSEPFPSPKDRANTAAPPMDSSDDASDAGPATPALADNSNAVPLPTAISKQTAKKLTNIIGLEVTGFEVPDAPPVAAAPESSQPNKSTTGSSPSSTKPAAPSTTTPPAAAPTNKPS
jgi:hypothetical protein